jgi:hypothetical protein
MELEETDHITHKYTIHITHVYIHVYMYLLECIHI